MCEWKLGVGIAYLSHLHACNKNVFLSQRQRVALMTTSQLLLGCDRCGNSVISLCSSFLN